MNRLAVFLALGVCTAWMLWRDAKERPSVPAAVWIAVGWAVIYASRPVTSWFGEPDLTASRDEGNLGEALIYMGLIMAGLVTWLRRDAAPSAIVRDNGWLFVFYLFWCTSVFWAEYPFITLKRLIKDLGNIVMVGLVLTSPAPLEAIRAVFVRCACVCIPLSIALIRYVPDVGRSYVGYHSSEVMYLGVAGHKNALGMLSTVAAIFLLWDLLSQERPWRHRTALDIVSLTGRGLVLAMSWYLLAIADSATSLVCAGFGSVLVAALKLPALRRSPLLFEGSAVAGALAVWSVDAVFNLKEAFVRRLGRDMTLTTRTDIWQGVISQNDSPILGAGFDSFWTGRRLVEVGGSFNGIIQAHNGYLETYLNGGWVGVGLLGILLIWGYARIRRAWSHGAPDSGIRLVFLLLAIVHNVAEASFNKVSILWFAAVLALMEFRGDATAPSVEPALHASAAAGERRP